VCRSHSRGMKCNKSKISVVFRPGKCSRRPCHSVSWPSHGGPSLSPGAGSDPRPR
jgi:hypothetical protein